MTTTTPRLARVARLLAALALALASAAPARAQLEGPEEEPQASKFKDPITRFWFNTYGNIRLTDRVFWVAQTHFRFRETDDVPLFGQPAQLYNRHALSYLFSKYFQASVGGVARINFNPDEVLPGERRAVPEWRIWHEYLFATSVGHAKVYHRIRLEHRWSRDYPDDAEYIFRNRWRYMFAVKHPLNKPKLTTGAFYIGPEAELIMQSGKAVVDSPMEDLRLHTALGYILSPRLTLATGAMYSFGQTLDDGAVYSPKWTWRAHMYFTPDFRKVKNKLPDIHRDE